MGGPTQPLKNLRGLPHSGLVEGEDEVMLRAGVGTLSRSGRSGSGRERAGGRRLSEEEGEARAAVVLGLPGSGQDVVEVREGAETPTQARRGSGRAKGRVRRAGVGSPVQGLSGLGQEVEAAAVRAGAGSPRLLSPGREEEAGVRRPMRPEVAAAVAPEASPLEGVLHHLLPLPWCPGSTGTLEVLATRADAPCQPRGPASACRPGPEPGWRDRGRSVL